MKIFAHKLTLLLLLFYVPQCARQYHSIKLHLGITKRFCVCIALTHSLSPRVTHSGRRPLFLYLFFLKHYFAFRFRTRRFVYKCVRMYYSIYIGF